MTEPSDFAFTKALAGATFQFQLAQSRIAELKERKDHDYLERNMVVALLATLFPSGILKTAIPSWDPEWHGCVYIDLPTGQVSWHYHDSQEHLFKHLPPYQGEWDGHTTDEKYQRVLNLMQGWRGHQPGR